ncbi:MAG: DUF4115 domain-containing protein [Gallionella sp.]
MMEQENKREASVAPDDQTTQSVGCRLRDARVRMDLSVEDVVDKIKLAPRQIVALEADDFQALPEMAFVRGFVRCYANLLQIDAQPLLDSLPETVRLKSETPPVDAPFPKARSARRQNLNLLIAAMLITLLLAAFTLWQEKIPPLIPLTENVSSMVSAPLALHLPEAVSAPVALSFESPAPSPHEPMPSSSKVTTKSLALSTLVDARPAKSAILTLVFDHESWAEIKDQSGKMLSSQINPPGSELHLKGDPPFDLVIGQAATVKLYYRGKRVDMTPYINVSSDVARLTLK